jgi:hypothetical protein
MFQKAYFYPLFAILFWAGNVIVSKWQVMQFHLWRLHFIVWFLRSL